jgi:hypothetical protein
LIHSDERDVTSREIGKLPQPKADAVALRFVQLRPSDSLVRFFDLSGPVQTVTEGHVSDMNSVHFEFYYESLTQYQVPDATNQVIVDMSYEGGVLMMSVPQFTRWHGKSPADLGLWTGRARSDRITITNSMLK